HPRVAPKRARDAEIPEIQRTLSSLDTLAVLAVEQTKWRGPCHRALTASCRNTLDQSDWSALVGHRACCALLRSPCATTCVWSRPTALPQPRPNIDQTKHGPVRERRDGCDLLQPHRQVCHQSAL